ncbi:hypothetical protein CHLNCDRAFT_145276 [Chlorella variabilis]|uniref:Methyltransferase domain-containing protein n=1 Tax=Chlorella variabilis TaxID=554065 RepID=E1ZE32_CHLVA|nr:hypothetical protein CHLNCDRAFT_145276 [Chlorella variabilis]EFN55961.1 hypothetical protein CHLNCDRAFT_145276 [Chlorella variabilis]|eukprot:XP_005848063.1 hypothetical protein CHLNCDRAFT_145276 [Chlorella variabilis]
MLGLSPASCRPRPASSGSYRRSTPVRAMLEQWVTQEDGRVRSNATAAAAAAPEQAVKPGDDDRTRFQLHFSVDMWRSFYPSRWLEASIDNEAAPLQDRIQAFTDTLSNAVSTAGILGSTDAARFWAYHLTRSGFFMIQGVASLLATRQAIGQNSQSQALTRFETMFRRGWAGPLTEALLTFYQDFENIKAGADAGQPEQIWLRSSLLPDYFQNTFHYQTDGWLSAESAKVYETSTETLFVGRQDAMQRSTLVPLREFMEGKDASQLKALEIGAGTGRFATFVKDNYPALQLTVSDLSPFYLSEARSNMQYWKKMRASDAQLGGLDGTGVTFLQTAAEKLDVPDSSQDIVYAVYLFHELPADVRRQAIKEMARVTKPGGIVILTDSAQLGDRLVYDDTLGRFSDFNEPFYCDYIATPLGPLFEEAGLQCGIKLVASTTKTLSFRKPVEGDMFALGGNAAAAATAAAAEVAAEAQEDE